VWPTKPLAPARGDPEQPKGWMGECEDYEDAARVLEQTLEDEETTDEKLTALAEKLNKRAETADQAPNI